jgi:5'-phosphate synthase pdxT subunit
VSRSPVIGVLALQGDYREHLSMLEAVGSAGHPVRTAEEIDAVDALVVPGGESTTMSLLADRFDLWTSLYAARQRHLPMFGTCAGLIMLADSLLDARPDQHTIGGLAVTVRRNAFGRQVDSFETTIDLPDLAIRDFPGVFIRAPRVETSDPAVQIHGVLHDGALAGTIVCVQQGPVLATAFHPELTSDTRIHEYFVQMVRQAQ